MINLFDTDRGRTVDYYYLLTQVEKYEDFSGRVGIFGILTELNNLAIL